MCGGNYAGKQTSSFIPSYSSLTLAEAVSIALSIRGVKFQVHRQGFDVSYKRNFTKNSNI